MTQTTTTVHGYWRKNPKTGKLSWVHSHQRKIDKKERQDEDGKKEEGQSWDGFQQNLTTDRMLAFAAPTFWREMERNQRVYADTPYGKGYAWFYRLLGNAGADLDMAIARVQYIQKPSGIYAGDEVSGFMDAKSELLDDLNAIKQYSGDQNENYLMYMLRRLPLTIIYTERENNLKNPPGSEAFWRSLGKQDYNSAVNVLVHGGTKVRLTDPGVKPQDIYSEILYTHPKRFYTGHPKFAKMQQYPFLQRAYREGLAEARKDWLKLLGHDSISNNEIRVTTSGYTAYDDWVKTGE